MVQVIVTRPEREAAPWVAALRARGVNALALPLIAIGPAPDPAALQAARQALPSCVATMFVSGNAVRGFFHGSSAAALPGAGPGGDAVPRFWAPGPGTREALLEAGVPPARIDAPPDAAGRFDSEALWEVVQAQVRPGQRVLLVRGASIGADATGGEGREWLTERLRERGLAVEAVAAYSRGLPVWSAAERARATAAAADGSLWLFSSSQALDHLARLLPGQPWSHARAIASHPRIARAARVAGFGQVRESGPTLEDMVASIESAR